MIEQVTLGSISQVGFPIVVSIYTLTRLEKTVQTNTEVMHSIKEQIQACKLKQPRH